MPIKKKVTSKDVPGSGAARKVGEAKESRMQKTEAARQVAYEAVNSDVKGGPHIDSGGPDDEIRRLRAAQKAKDSEYNKRMDRERSKKRN